jgi:hypothetical protein
MANISLLRSHNLDHFPLRLSDHFFDFMHCPGFSACLIIAILFYPQDIPGERVSIHLFCTIYL